jgi:hypothetical protein
MFVTFVESQTIQRGCDVHNGSTVSILSKGAHDMYTVGAYDASGNWNKWTAHIDELIGFDASLVEHA